jgi:hypothetical protein
MKRSTYIKLMVIVIFSLFIVLNAFAKDPQWKPFPHYIPQAWTQITPGPTKFMHRDLNPTCSGAPGTDPTFKFFVKGGPINNLVVFFDGGGACWDTMNCIYYPTYYPAADETVQGLTGAGGIFDTDNPANPFKDWNFVFIPYCTGDIHWGSNDKQYFDYLNWYGGVTFTIHHRGFDNFLVVLKWINENFSRPHEIFVTGSSAGSYGAMLAFPYIQEAYPESKASILGDAGFGVVSEDFHNNYINNWGIQQNLPHWIPGFKRPFSEYSNAEMYKMIAHSYPHRKIGQYTTAWDATQAFFYNVMLNTFDPTKWSSPPPQEVWFDWHQQMIGYADLAAQAPNYRYYIGAGCHHTIMGEDKFFDEDSAGVPFVDWINAMVGNQGSTHGHGGIPWKNVECIDCSPSVNCP